MRRDRFAHKVTGAVFLCYDGISGNRGLLPRKKEGPE